MIEVLYEDFPVGAQAIATVNSEDIQPFTDNAEVTTGIDGQRWATLEYDGWPLDGTCALLPDEPEDIGWWSDTISDKNGSFADPPTLTLTFPDPYTTSGFTFTFAPATSQYPTRLRLRWYNGSTLLEDIEEHPTGVNWVLMHRVASFDRFEIQFLQVNGPYQFAKLDLLQVGVFITFGRNELVSVNVVNEVDPSLGQLSVDSMTVTVLERRGYVHVPQENQRMTLYENGAPVAIQYIENSSRASGNSYTFNCKSAIGLLDDEFLGGIYTYEPVKDLLDAVLGGMWYDLDPFFENATLTGYLPTGTRRGALQQICFALGAIPTSQGVDGVRFIPVPTESASLIQDDRIFFGGSLQTSAVVGMVEIYVHEYTESTEEAQLKKGAVDGEDVLFTFNEPYHDYTITGGEITGSGANFVRLTAHGEIELKGQKYIHSTYRKEWRNTAATAAERNNTITVKDATLINSANADDILRRLYQYYLLRKTLTEDIVVRNEQAGILSVTDTPWGANLRGFISSVNTNYTLNGKTASITMVGADVPGITSLFYSGDLYAGEEMLY